MGLKKRRGSGEVGQKISGSNIDHLTSRDEVKFCDGLAAKITNGFGANKVQRYDLSSRLSRRALFSPIFGRIDPS